MKKDLPYISFARALSILLVVNSHATGLYPDAIANIAGRGGAIGNTLFFFVSGFTLYFSAANRSLKTGGGQWILRRLLRIWPAIWIFYGISVLFGAENIQWFDFFLPLSTNWFLGAILVFYPVFFMCVRFWGNKIPLQIALAFVAFVAAFWGLEADAQKWVVGVGSPWNLHWIYYFGIMLLGAELARRNFFDKPVFAETRLSKLIFSALIFAGTVIVYYAMRGGLEIFKLWKLQFIAPFALPLVCVSGIAFCRIFAGYFSKLFEGFSYGAISFVSNRTLEIYLVHGIGLGLCASLFFPGNLAAALAITLGIAAVLKIVSNAVSRALRFLPFLRNN